MSRDLDVDVRIVLKWIVVKMWTRSEYVTFAGCCNSDNRLWFRNKMRKAHSGSEELSIFYRCFYREMFTSLALMFIYCLLY
jgi:hypothetical protein